MPINKKILTKLRKDANQTQKDMAIYLGISVHQYQNYESGRSDLTVSKLEKLADFFGVSTDYLLGRLKVD